MLKKVIVRLSNEQLITPGGLATVGHLAAQTSLYKEMDKLGDKDYDYPNSAIAGAALGILSQGKSDFEAVNEFAEEKEYYSGILGIKNLRPVRSTARTGRANF